MKAFKVRDGEAEVLVQAVSEERARARAQLLHPEFTTEATCAELTAEELAKGPRWFLSGQGRL